MAAFRSRHRHGGRWWASGTTLAAAVVALFFVALAGAKPAPPPQPSGPFPVPTGPIGVSSTFEDNDANMPPNSGVPVDSNNTSANNTGGGYTVNFDWNKLEPNGLTWGPYNSGNQSGTGSGTGGLSTNGGWQTAGVLAPIGNASGQNSFAGGTKQDQNCPSVIGGGVQNKDDLKGIYLAAKTLTSGPLSGHTILEAAWERAPQQTTSSSAHVAFEFNQSNTACGAGSDGLVQRTAQTATQPGDLLLVFDFTGGSTTPPTISESRWISSGTCEVSSDAPPCWGTFVNLSSLNEAEANVDDGLSHLCQGSGSTSGCGPNEVDVSSNGAGTTFALPSSTRDCLAAGSGPSGSTLGACDSLSSPTTGGYALGTSEFGEAGVDLTAAGVFGSAQCVSFGQVEGISRSSGNSSQAAMEKLVGPASFTLSNCSTGISTQPKSGSSATGTFSNMTQGTDGTWGTVTANSYVKDQATVTVTPSNLTWTGNVAFYICKSTTSTLTSCDPSGSNATQVDSAVAVSNATTTSPNANKALSSAYRVTDAGSYCWAAVFTHSTPTGLPDKSSTSGECFSATAPTSIATNPFVYPQDRVTISASSGGNLSGSVKFRLYDSYADCSATTPSDTVGSGGLLYKESGQTNDSVSGASPQSVNTNNTQHKVTSTTAGNLYWLVEYTSSGNSLQTGSSSACVENVGATITPDGTVTFP